MDKSRTKKIVALSTGAVVGLSAATIVLLQEPGAAGHRLNAVKSALTDEARAARLAPALLRGCGFVLGQSLPRSLTSLWANTTSSLICTPELKFRWHPGIASTNIALFALPGAALRRAAARKVIVSLLRLLD